MGIDADCSVSMPHLYDIRDPFFERDHSVVGAVSDKDDHAVPGGGDGCPHGHRPIEGVGFVSRMGEFSSDSLNEKKVFPGVGKGKVIERVDAYEERGIILVKNIGKEAGTTGKQEDQRENEKRR